MSITQVFERNQEATLYIGNVDQKIDDEVLWELMVQAGPLSSVHLPKDKITQQHMGYGFIEYKSEEDADYAIKVLNMVKLFGKPIRLNKSSRDKRVTDIGANLFVGNLSDDVDEKTLYDTFASFGVLMFAKIMRDDNNESKGFGFISYDTFDAGDNALANMNGQFLCNRPISVSYAYKKDSRGERHGSAAERLLAEYRPEGTPAKGGKGQDGKGGKGGKGGGKGDKGHRESGGLPTGAGLPPLSSGPPMSVPPLNSGPPMSMPPFNAGPPSSMPPLGAGPPLGMPPFNSGVPTGLPPFNPGFPGMPPMAGTGGPMSMGGGPMMSKAAPGTAARPPSGLPPRPASLPVPPRIVPPPAGGPPRPMMPMGGPPRPPK
eukprot:GEMP01045203.1.p1 GENE.GEMP01045203.1~~GEMP01045203.1.p1  ORF type:complete len:374 (+),score=91.29 GEMP01045203.1:12-1133(+)